MHNSDFQVGYRSNDTIYASYLVAERVCTNKLNAGNMISGRKHTSMRWNKLFSFASFASIYFICSYLSERSYNSMKIQNFSVTFRLIIYQFR